MLYEGSTAMKHASCLRAFLVGISLFTFSTALMAQNDRGTITGSVTDPSQALVIGAKVEAKNLDTGNTFDTTTTSAGDFTISSVTVGRYSISVTAPGFK